MCVRLSRQAAGPTQRPIKWVGRAVSLEVKWNCCSLRLSILLHLAPKLRIR